MVGGLKTLKHKTGVLFTSQNVCMCVKLGLTFQNTNLMHNSFILQQYICYTTLLNMFRAACCSKHVEERSVIYIYC